jgi:ATP-dependent DNA helicase RecG
MNELEYEHVENKRSLSERHEAIISVAAFATARGGLVRFGIAPEGRRVGVQIGRVTLEELANAIRQNTDPPQYPSITVEGDEASGVITVQVEESPIKPVWAFGKPYKRVGRTNQSLSRDETQRLVDQTTGRTWDALPCIGLTEEALDRRAIENYLKRAGQDVSTSTSTVLETLRLRLPDGSLCNAAALLFAAKPWLHLTGVQVKCGRFRGTTSVDFLDARDLEGNVLTQLDDALAFIERNTHQAFRITGRPEREIVPEYPDAAVREAITNAICHRDYAAAGHVQIRIYDDRLEVWNPATLPFDLTIAQLYEEHHSHPRNRKLADAFYRARLIEHWGTGTIRMVRACEARGMKQPEYRFDMGAFIVRFWSLPVVQERPQQIKLNERQMQAVALIRRQGPITVSQYAAHVGIAERTARRELANMIELGALIRIAVGPTTRYSIPELASDVAG